MTKILKILAVAAIAQLVLIAFSVSSGPQLQTQGSSGQLLSFHKRDIDRIIIEDNNGKQIELAKTDQQWQTTDAFPADAHKLDALLDKLGTLKIGLPVATSKTALKRFKLTEDDFERHIKLKKADATQAELYIGSGAGARQSHVRRSDQQLVYTVAIGNYDLPVKSADWQDKNLLNFDKDKVTSITLDGVTVNRDKPSTSGKSNSPHWQADGLKPGQVLDQSAIDAALTQLSNLHFSKVLGKETKPEYGMDNPALTISVDRQQGKRQYQFGQLKGMQDYALKISDRDEYFKITAGAATALINKFSMNKWLIEKSNAEEETATDDKTSTEPTQTGHKQTAPQTPSP